MKSLYAVLRYLPLTPRLQRLYALRAIAEHMTWHATHQMEEDSVCHRSDAEAWRNFDRTYPNFPEESHNVQLRLCIGWFAPHGQYSYLLMLANCTYTLQYPPEYVHEFCERIEWTVPGIKRNESNKNKTQ
ncbi:UNVERIFIED_CONTAM: hypothetical protein Slati_2700800 [Sesamum latifolium]|uniref:Uncharacterized protein n=1 Tax=Sesamum latifolium TaxID=2727402 RepID=A0AAW2W060_9LAMI